MNRVYVLRRFIPGKALRVPRTQNDGCDENSDGSGDVNSSVTGGQGYHTAEHKPLPVPQPAVIPMQQPIPTQQPIQPATGMSGFAVPSTPIQGQAVVRKVYNPHSSGKL